MLIRGRVFEEGFTPHDRGLSEEEITAYLSETKGSFLFLD